MGKLMAGTGGHAVGNIYDVAYDPSGLVSHAAASGNPVIYAALNYRTNRKSYFFLYIM
jgi:hypothetical protein